MEKLESFTFPRWFTRCGIDSLTGTHLIDLNSFFLFSFCYQFLLLLLMIDFKQKKSSENHCYSKRFRELHVCGWKQSSLSGETDY